MNKLKEIKENNKTIKYKLLRYEDLLTNFDQIFPELCTFLSIEHFNPKPNNPNSSFDNHSSINDFKNRWKSWTIEKKLMFKEYAGNQLIEWDYEKTNDSW